MAVVPGDELGRRVASPEVFPGHVQATVGLRAGREHDRVVAGAQVGQADVAAELDPPEEPEAWVVGEGFELAHHALDLEVVGRDAETHESVRDREALEQVDANREVGALEQVLDREEAGRTGPDDGDAQGLGLGSGTAHGSLPLRRATVA